MVSEDSDVQSCWNKFEAKLIQVVDKILPTTEFVNDVVVSTTPQHEKHKLSLRNSLYRKFKNLPLELQNQTALALITQKVHTNIVSSFSNHPAHCYLNSIKLFQILSNQYCNPEVGFDSGSEQDGCLEYCQATIPNTQPPRLVILNI